MDKRYDNIEELEIKKSRKSFGIVEKFNPYHGYHGYFASANTAGAYAPLHGKTENGQRLLDHYKETHGGKVGGGGGKISQEDLDDVAADSVAEIIETVHSTPHKTAEGHDLFKAMDKDKVIDMKIEDVLKEQGFDGKPKVVGMDEFSKAVEANGNIAVRGIAAENQETADAYVDQLQNGEFYVKCTGGAAFGRGMYCAMRPNTGTNEYSDNVSVADAYANQSINDHGWGTDGGKAIINMTLDSTAKTISFEELKEMAKKDPVDPDKFSPKNFVYYDFGAYAAAKGYDAIVSNASGYVVVLNRTKLTILDQTGDLNSMPGGKDVLDAGAVPF